LRYEDFTPYVWQIFLYTRFDDTNVSLSLRLIKAEKTGTSPIEGYRDNFRLLLQEVGGENRGQAQCVLQHPERGKIELLLIPTIPDPEGTVYQVIFA
jgi:hypothetical protein